MKALARLKTSGDAALGTSVMMLKIFSIKTNRTAHEAAPHPRPPSCQAPIPEQETGSGR